MICWTLLDYWNHCGPSWIGSQNRSTLTSGVRNKEKQANAHKLMVIGLYTKSIWRRNGIWLPTVRKKN